MKRRLAVVDAYCASGQKAKAWALVHGVSLGELSSWCCHARRWRSRLSGVTLGSRPSPPATGFVAAKIAAEGSSTTVRVELSGASVALALHWPVSHSRELAAWVREVAR
jgi:hypothetical protein